MYVYIYIYIYLVKYTYMVSSRGRLGCGFLRQRRRRHPCRSCSCACHPSRGRRVHGLDAPRVGPLPAELPAARLQRVVWGGLRGLHGSLHGLHGQGHRRKRGQARAASGERRGELVASSLSQNGYGMISAVLQICNIVTYYSNGYSYTLLIY